MDTIGEDGCLTVQNGTSVIETGADQNLFVRWYRSSNSTSDFQKVTQSKILNGHYNIPELDGPKVNVSIDEGADQYYKAEIYKVEDNQELVLATTDPYHVPYYDDVRNGGFETPHNNGTTDESVNRWPSNWQVENGQSGVVWKTTGLANDGTNRDIEIPQGPDSNGQGANNLGETLRNYCFAFMPEGNQCAELNCEASGALYQDVLTIPGSQLYWSLYHRARGAYDYWKTKTDKTQNSETDTMYVVAMPKELAEKYDVTTQAKVLSILDHVNDPNSEFHDIEIVRITTTNKGNGTIEFMNSGSTLTVPPTYFGNLPNGGTATVYDSGTRLTFKYGNTDWHYYTGNFSIPENQYLTRFFFVAGNTASNNPTMGNFLDGISMSDSVFTPNHGQATVIIKKTVEGLDTLPQDYATRIETKYQTTKSNSVTTTTEKDSDFDSYRSQIDGQSGKLVSIASWTYPISIDNGDSIVFTKSEETAPENNAKTDTVIGYTQTTSYMIRKQSSGQSDPGVIARGSGKIIPAEEIQRLTVEEKDIIYIEYINTYVPKKTSVTLEKVDRADLDNENPDLLKGAAFILSKYNSEEFREKDDTWGTNGSKELKDTKNPDGTYTLNGSFTFEDLPIGFYQIEETAFPNGYIQLNSNPTFKIEVNASNELFITLINNPDNLLRLVDGQLTIVVGNIPGAALPNTGGPGTTLIYLIGTMLAGIAGAVLMIRKCTRES